MFGIKSKKPLLIFIAEDNAAYARTLQLFLKEKLGGATVEIFPVGELCIDNLHRNPDVVIMDYILNTKYYDASDGLEMIREIKSKNKHAQIIMLSGQEDVQVALKIIKEVDTNYVPKDDDAFKNVLGIIRKAYPDRA
jgi:DNA-binding NarL/FixJ family response regulator